MEHHAAGSTAMQRPSSFRLARGLAAALAVMILLQAFLGGRGFFLSPNLLQVHQVVGITVLGVAIVQVWAVISTIPEGLGRARLLRMSGAIVVLTAIQLGLGFSAKSGSNEAAAWHIFTGVLLTGAIADYGNKVFRLKADRGQN